MSIICYHEHETGKKVVIHNPTDAEWYAAWTEIGKSFAEEFNRHFEQFARESELGALIRAYSALPASEARS